MNVIITLFKHETACQHVRLEIPIDFISSNSMFHYSKKKNLIFFIWHPFIYFVSIQNTLHQGTIINFHSSSISAKITWYCTSIVFSEYTYCGKLSCNSL